MTVEMILENLHNNVANAKKILKAAIAKVGRLKRFSAADALKYAIVTRREHIPENKLTELDIIIGKYFKRSQQSTIDSP